MSSCEHVYDVCWNAHGPFYTERHIVLPTQAEISGKPAGFNIAGGAETGQPVTITKVDPGWTVFDWHAIWFMACKIGSVAQQVGMRTGDEILFCNGIDFRVSNNFHYGDRYWYQHFKRPINKETQLVEESGISHADAARVIRGAAGKEMILRSN